MAEVPKWLELLNIIYPFFRKRFSFVVLAALASLFFIISQTNDVFAENKKITDEIEVFLSIQK